MKNGLCIYLATAAESIIYAKMVPETHMSILLSNDVS